MLSYATGADDLAIGDELYGILHTGDIGYLDQSTHWPIVWRAATAPPAESCTSNAETRSLLRHPGRPTIRRYNDGSSGAYQARTTRQEHDDD